LRERKSSLEAIETKTPPEVVWLRPPAAAISGVAASIHSRQ